MQYDEFFKLASNRRSIHKFKSDPIPDEYVEKILDVARWAPSGANSQPWEFIVIKNRVTIKKLAEAYARYQEIALWMDMTRLEEYRNPSMRIPTPINTEEAARARFTLWSNAPVVIAVLGDQRTLQASTLAGRLFGHHTFEQSLATANYAMHLAASSLGLGAQWISLPWPAAEDMKPILGIPTILTPFTLNAIGYPAVDPVSLRRDLREMVHYEKYDMSKFRSNKDIQEYVKNLGNQRDKHAGWKIPIDT